MAIAALYDVHGMVQALDAVLAEPDVASADVIVIGGDVAAGPFPRETLERLRELGDRALWVRGNADRELGGWTREQLRDEEIAFLQDLPRGQTLGRVQFCHATPRSDEEILTAISPEDAWLEAFAAVDASLVVAGHTHMQLDRMVGDVRFVNAGSVGMPYEDEVVAFWTLIAGDDVEFRKTLFDIDRTAAEIEVSGWPGAQEFVAENLFVAPSRDEATQLFESWR
ncbi:MAG: metallophosphoesterase family protein [Actinomycetota bacterium]|nr:metallophosphoesterase family protein [Actinomycetota bacterium]